MANGRGAWPSNGAGGTLSYDGKSAGPYYRLSTGDRPQVGSSTNNNNERAVHGAVKAYQRALRRRTGIRLRVDGLFGPVTSNAVLEYQRLAGLVQDGVIGRNTSKQLLWPDLRRRVRRLQSMYPNTRAISPLLVCGFITHESSWDAGAVGYLDDRDVGLAQINGTAHPEWSFEERLLPVRCFDFIFHYVRGSLEQLDGDIKLAVASYNLGVGGARTWDREGRPNPYTPPGSTTPRDMDHYIWNIRNVCKEL